MNGGLGLGASRSFLILSLEALALCDAPKADEDMFFAELFGDDEPVIKKLDPGAPTLVENVLMHPGLRLKLILPPLKEYRLEQQSSSDNTWLLLTSGKSRPVTAVLKHKSAVPLEILRLRLFFLAFVSILIEGDWISASDFPWLDLRLS